MLKSTKNGIPAKVRKEEFNEDLKGEVLKKKINEKSQWQMRRIQSQSKVKDDNMANDEAQEILS